MNNVKKYFYFPLLIHFVSFDELNNMKIFSSNDDIIFHDYVGGIYSHYIFYNLFITKQYEFNEYMNIFHDLINQINHQNT
jgi:hypothetical protein